MYALFSLNVSFKIWPTNESLRFSKNQHSGVEKQSVALQKMIEKKKGEQNELRQIVYFAFFIIHLSILFFFDFILFPFLPVSFLS